MKIKSFCSQSKVFYFYRLLGNQAFVFTQGQPFFKLNLDRTGDSIRSNRSAPSRTTTATFEDRSNFLTFSTFKSANLSRKGNLSHPTKNRESEDFTTSRFSTFDHHCLHVHPDYTPTCLWAVWELKKSDLAFVSSRGLVQVLDRPSTNLNVSLGVVYHQGHEGF